MHKFLLSLLFTTFSVNLFSQTQNALQLDDTELQALIDQRQKAAEISESLSNNLSSINMVGQINADSTWVEKTGSDNPLNGVDIGSYAKLAIVDIDNDGDNGNSSFMFSQQDFEERVINIGDYVITIDEEYRRTKVEIVDETTTLISQGEEITIVAGETLFVEGNELEDESINENAFNGLDDNGDWAEWADEFGWDQDDKDGDGNPADPGEWGFVVYDYDAGNGAPVDTFFHSWEVMQNEDGFPKYQVSGVGSYIYDRHGLNYITVGVDEWIEFGASPRATIALDRCARAHAWLAGRDFVGPDDIQAVFHNALRHRIILSYQAEAEGVNTNQVLNKILNLVAVP